MNKQQDNMNDQQNCGEKAVECNPEVGQPDVDVLEMLQCVKSNVDQLRSDMIKQFDLYALMTEHRDRAELMLTKLTDLLNKVYLLDAFSKKELSATEVTSEVIQSMQKRIGALLNYCMRLAGSFGITPVAPQVGDDFNPEEQLIVGTVNAPPGLDVAGKIAICEHMGCIRSGRVTPAEVIVYKAPESTEVTV